MTENLLKIDIHGKICYELAWFSLENCLKFEFIYRLGLYEQHVYAVVASHLMFFKQLIFNAF